MTDSFFKELAGKQVMIRTYDAGVHFGKLEDARDGQGSFAVRLSNSKRVYSWTGANSLSQLSVEGSKKTDSRISVTVPTLFLKAIEIIEMMPDADANLRAIKTWRFDT